MQGLQVAGRVRESILEAMRQTIGRDRLIGAGDRIVIGLSGGADSVTLSVLLPDVARELGAEVVAIAHLNHCLRPTADEDQRFCGEFAARVGLPFESEAADVRALARERRTSIEDAGRIARYAFLRRVMARRGATRIAVAHTRNDQAETVLLRLCRGAGPKGLASIFPKVGPVIRPLLDVRRAAIEAFVAAAEGIAFREDPTNRDVTIPRNRVRHELLPYLAQHVGDGIVDVLARQAVIAREDADWLEQAATESARSLVLEEEAGFSVDARGLRELHPALARRVIQAVLTRIAAGGPDALDGAKSKAGRGFIGFDHVDAVLRLAAGAETAAETIDLPRSRVKQIGGRLLFEPRPPDPGRAGRRRGRPAAPRTVAAAESGADASDAPDAGEGNKAAAGVVMTHKNGQQS